MNNNPAENTLSEIRNTLSSKMSEKRLTHTLEVEKMAARLGEIYAPKLIFELRAAALLHDITKELTTEQHVEILDGHGITVNESDLRSPKTLHARTAALLIPELYPSLDVPEIVLAVRYHTTGKENMSLEQKLIYLADYIDMSRTFEDCVRLREYFFNFNFENATEEEKLTHLDQTLIMSYDMTVRGLIDSGKIVNEDTFRARNYLILNNKK